MKIRSLAAALFLSQTVIAQTGNVGIGTIAPQSQFHTTGSVRHDTLAGNGNRLVYASAQGHLTTLAVPLNTNVTPTQIPNNGCYASTGAISSITVSGQPASVASANIKVRVDISHTNDADVHVFLLSPAGDILSLIFQNGGNGDNFTNTIFCDGASQSLPGASNAAGAPFSGVYKPSGGTSACGINAFANTFGAMGGGTINPNGVWQLLIFDRLPTDYGRLNNWGISFDGSDPPVPAPNYETSFQVNFFNGPTTWASNYTVKAVRVGSQVTLTFPTDLTTLTVSANIMVMAVGPLPQQFIPPSSLYVPMVLQSNGLPYVGIAHVTSSGIGLYGGNLGAPFNGPNSGIRAGSISYSVQ